MKKILSISILFLMIINIFYSSYAFEQGTKEIQLKSWCSRYLKYKDVEVYVPYVSYWNGSKDMPAYCMNPNLPGVGTNNVNSYKVNIVGKITNEKVWRVLINSYPYKSLESLGVQSPEEAFYATKIATAIFLEPSKKIEDYSTNGSSEASQRVYNLLKNLVRIANESDDVLINNDKISISSVDDWKIDGNYLSKTYKLNSVVKEGVFTLNLSGNLPEGSLLADDANEPKTKFNLHDNFKIMVPSDKLNEVYKFTLNATSTLKTYPIYKGKTTIDGTQDYALLPGEEEETLKCSLTDSTLKNTTKITILKKEYGTDKKLSGVKFNLLDKDKKIIQENLITDDNGEIEITGILPGKYFIQEVETLEGYVLYTDLIETNIKLNEEVNVIVNNSLKSVSEVTKDTTTVEVVENKTENYYENNNTETTVKNNGIENNFENNTTKTDITNNKIKKLPVTGY